VIKIKKYIITFGAVVIVLTLIFSFLSSIYASYINCKDVIKTISLSEKPQSAEELQENNKLLMECNGVLADVYLSYFFIGLGVAIIVGGFITMKLK
tara:strand:- start:318 stop:605 length:288 start_codon:yes stop_codon:yes gene_type:complete